MSDPTPTAPILVSGDPIQAQMAAGIRQVGGALGVIVAAFGFTGVAAKIGIVVSVAPQIAIVLAVVGPAAWGVLTWIGQLSTRRRAQQLAVTAAAAPDEVAQVVAK